MVSTYDFSGISRNVDVGGGQDELISAILKANPDSLVFRVHFKLPLTHAVKRVLLLKERYLLLQWKRGTCEKDGGSTAKN